MGSHLTNAAKLSNDWGPPQLMTNLWNHVVLEDFLVPEDFERLRQQELDSVAPDDIKIYHNKVCANGRVEAENLPAEFLLHMQKRYHGRSLQILKDLAPKKVSLYDYSDFHLVVTGRGIAPRRRKSRRFSRRVHARVPRRWR